MKRGLLLYLSERAALASLVIHNELALGHWEVAKTFAWDRRFYLGCLRDFWGGLV